MVDGPGSGPQGLSGSRPTDEPGGSPGAHSGTRSSRARVTYTVFGVLVTVGVIAVALLRPSVADPSVMGLVWAGLAAVLLIGFVFPMVSLRVLRMTVTTAPTDLVVGQLSSVEVEFRGRVSGLMARCGRSPMFVVDITSPDEVKLPLEVANRGVYDHLPVEVSTDAPFSMVMASTRRLLPLRRQLFVGPRVFPGVAQLGTIGGDRSDIPSTGRAVSGDTVRSVRPYVVGDPPHMVHWPSSARLGSLVVRELEPPQRLGVAVMVPLIGDNGHESLEAAVSTAAGVVLDALGRGGRVVLCTATATGPVVVEVTDETQMRRSLALATSGQLSSAPEGWPVQVIAQHPVVQDHAEPGEVPPRDEQ